MPVFAVHNLSTDQFEPYLWSIKNVVTKNRVEAPSAVGNAYSINDGDYGTYLEFPVTGDANHAEMTFYFDRPITTESLSFALDRNVALPQKISINANISGKDYVVLAPTQPSFWNIAFPKTTSSVWRVAFDYVQPLRISEMKFDDVPSQFSRGGELRFLAQPGQKYQIYYAADRYVKPVDRESGDLSSDKGILYLDESFSIPNPEYKQVDSDADSVPDVSDNCINVPNFDQKDSDGNGRGDACEDYDRDGILNANDNCPDIPNVSQIDTDNDKIGDVCDTLDNRVTERLPWLPWAGIGVAGVVIIGLFAVALLHKKEDGQ